MPRSSSPNSERLIDVKPRDSKAPLIIANTKIPAGTLIFTDKPFLTMDHSTTAHIDLINNYAALPQNTKDFILSLPFHDTAAFRDLVFHELEVNEEDDEDSWTLINEIYGVDTQQVLLAFNTNAVGPFLGARTAMLHHSCEPNAYAAFDERKREITLHALRDIEGREEVCVSYLDGVQLFRSTSIRREILVLQRGLHCVCSTCVTGDDLGRGGRSGRRYTVAPREQLGAMVDQYNWKYDLLGARFRGYDARRLEYKAAVSELRDICRRIAFGAEALNLSSPDTLEWYQNAAHWSRVLKDHAKAEEWKKHALRIVRIGMGKDSNMYRSMAHKLDGKVDDV